MKKTIIVFAVFILLLIPVFAQAAQHEPLTDPAQNAPVEQQEQDGDEEEETEDEELAETGFLSECNRAGNLGKCIQQIYLLALGLGSVVAVLMIILAGYRYMTAQGNAQQVESAKESFASAFIGLIIIFVAFLLLRLVNPDLTEFRDFTQILPLPSETTQNNDSTGQ